VFPPQPEGVWNIIYSSERWTTSTGPDRYRRGIYTFWRRTVPHPAMTTFDAPSREVCTSRRIRTNTPLQAFVTLNDPEFVEAAQALARRVLEDSRGGAPDPCETNHALWLLLGRSATPFEATRLSRLIEQQRARFTKDPAAAAKVAGVAATAVDRAELTELAALTVVCSVLLNLDETLTKE